MHACTAVGDAPLRGGVRPPCLSLLLMNSSSPTPRKRRQRFLVYGKYDVVLDWLVHFLTQLMAVLVFLLSLISAKSTHRSPQRLVRMFNWHLSGIMILVADQPRSIASGGALAQQHTLPFSSHVQQQPTEHQSVASDLC